MSLYRERVALGYCGNCGKNKDAESLFALCDKCREKAKFVKQKRKSQGLCVSCGKPKTNAGQRCTVCYEKDRTRDPIAYTLKNRARDILGSKTHWKELLSKFNQQQGLCAYTGLPVAIKEAQLDHIVPRALGGNNDISNLHWVHCLINKMKSSIPEDVFIYLCKQVAKNMPDVEMPESLRTIPNQK